MINLRGLFTSCVAKCNVQQLKFEKLDLLSRFTEKISILRIIVARRRRGITADGRRRMFLFIRMRRTEIGLGKIFCVSCLISSNKNFDFKFDRAVEREKWNFLRNRNSLARSVRRLNAIDLIVRALKSPPRADGILVVKYNLLRSRINYSFQMVFS